MSHHEELIREELRDDAFKNVVERLLLILRDHTQSGTHEEQKSKGMDTLVISFHDDGSGSVCIRGMTEEKLLEVEFTLEQNEWASQISL